MRSPEATRRLTGLGAAVPGGVLVAESQSLDILGNPTVSRTVLDRANRRVVQSSDGPASTLDALSVNGLTLTNVTATGVTTVHALGRRVASSQLVPNPVNPDNPVRRTGSIVSNCPFGVTLTFWA